MLWLTLLLFVDVELKECLSREIESREHLSQRLVQKMS